jgi:sec-independent protein translocase protein TatA
MLPLAFGFGAPQDLVIIALVVLVLFGGSKLAGFGKSMGEGIREFKKATRDDEEVPPPAGANTTPAPPANTTPTAPASTKTEEIV